MLKYDNDKIALRNLKTIYVPAKKADYYKERLSEDLHGLIVEQESVKNRLRLKRQSDHSFII